MAREKRTNGPAAGNDSPSHVKKRKLTTRPATKNDSPQSPGKKHPKQAQIASARHNGKKADSDSEFDGFTSEAEDADEPRSQKHTNGTDEPSKQTDQANKSRESHIKQKALTASRKASRSNAEEIAAAKKLWERLRRKSHVAKDERQKLVGELFAIVTGHVHDFVFKHDSVRVVQCAVKYSTVQQRKEIAAELRGSFRALAESRYAKFLLAKLITDGDADTRNMIIPEFYGHVRRMMSHPEASWILDDIYRTVATREQKARLLREWYGPDFAIFKTDDPADVTSDLSKILAESPEKRVALLRYLYERINQLIQKKSTGFTMLHDAMLQYFVQLSPESEDFTQFLTLVIGDNKEEEVDLLRNLAFTNSGSEIVCMTIAHSKAKERRLIIKAYKDVIEMLAYDKYGHRVLMSALEVFDDTREMKERIYSELIKLTKTATEEAQTEQILNLTTHQIGHISLLYPMIGAERKLLNHDDIQIMQKVKTIRETTSKKDPSVRRAELISCVSGPFLQTIRSKAEALIASSFGYSFITEAIFECEGDKSSALEAIAASVSSDPADADHPVHVASACKLLKSLVSGGRFDRAAGQVVPIEPPLHFADMLWAAIQEHGAKWITGDGGFVVLSLLESPWRDDTGRRSCRDQVNAERAALQMAVDNSKAKKVTPDVLRLGKCAELLLDAVS